MTRPRDHPYNPLVSSDDFLTSSPASRLSRGDFKPPRHSSQSDDGSNPADSSPAPVQLLRSKNTSAVDDDDIFRHSSGSEPQRPHLGSAESSSSTSLEVREIMEGSGSGKKMEPYLGDNMEEEEGTEDGGDKNSLHRGDDEDGYEEDDERSPDRDILAAAQQPPIKVAFFNIDFKQ